MSQDFRSEFQKEQDFRHRTSYALAVLEREGLAGEIKQAREAFQWAHWLRDLTQRKRRIPYPLPIAAANLPAELGHSLSLTEDDEVELKDAFTILIKELREAIAGNFQFAGTLRSHDISELSPAQLRVILYGEEPRQDSTLQALERKHMIAYDNGCRVMTDDARAYAWAVYDKSTRRMLEEDRRLDAPLIQSTYDLLELMFPRAEIDPEISIYVYRGSKPMVVRDGDGQNPLAYLHRYFLWQVEVDKTVGDFLEKYGIISHKGSYGYRMKPLGD